MSNRQKAEYRAGYGAKLRAGQSSGGAWSEVTGKARAERRAKLRAKLGRSMERSRGQSSSGAWSEVAGKARAEHGAKSRAKLGRSMEQSRGQSSDGAWSEVAGKARAERAIMHAPPAYESTNSVKKRILFVIFSSDDLFLCPVPLFKMVRFDPHMRMSNISANRASAKAISPFSSMQIIFCIYTSKRRILANCNAVPAISNRCQTG